MNQLWITVMSIAFLIFIGVLIYVLLELRKSARALTEFLKTTENSLKPALEELQQTLRSVRRVSDDINEVTEDIKTISGSARDIGHNLRKISDFLNEAGSEARIKVSGLKVGIRTAIEVLIKNLFLNKGGSQ